MNNSREAYVRKADKQKFRFMTYDDRKVWKFQAIMLLNFIRFPIFDSSIAKAHTCPLSLEIIRDATKSYWALG